MRAWLAVSHCPGRPSSSCHVKLSNCHFHPPKFLINARHQAVQVTSENCIFGDSSMFAQRSSDSASKKIQMWLSAVWSHFFAYTIWLFVSNTYIVSVTVIVMRKRISSLRGGKQKGGRIQNACEFSEPSSPFGMEEQCVWVCQSRAVAGIRGCPWWPVTGEWLLLSLTCVPNFISHGWCFPLSVFPSHTSTQAASREAESERKSWQGVNIFQCFITTELK